MNQRKGTTVSAGSFGFKSALTGLALLALGSCSPQFRNHGYVPDETELATLVVGVNTRAEVSEAFGVPVMSGMQDAGGYYYIHTRVRHMTYKEPVVIERDVVAISFDDEDVLTNIGRYSLKDGKVITLSRRVTKSGDVNKGVLRQLFANIGNISAGSLLE
jgi:outer membrane protein assembly factor BamE (lipoprotein component of BamABCDE complex)